MTAVDSDDDSDDDVQGIFIKSQEKITSFSTAHSIQNEAEHVVSTAKSAKEAGKIDKDDHLIIFVHGYNNSDDEVERRAEKIDKIYGTRNVVTRTFNWKSQNKLMEYGTDQYTALLVAQSFAQYIELIRSENHFKRIDIVCHSMGNFVLSQTILHVCTFYNKLDIFKGCNIICLAADVEPEQYNKTIKAVKDKVSSWCHYWCSGDYALKVSKKYNFTESRAGLKKCELKEDVVQNIEWKNWSRLKFWNTNHGYIDQVFDDADLAKDILDRIRSINKTVPVAQKSVILEEDRKQEPINIKKNQAFILNTAFGYIGCDKNGWMKPVTKASDAVVFEFEVSSSKYLYTHYKVKTCPQNKYNEYYLSYTGGTWCVGLYKRKKDALCIEYCCAKNKMIARGIESKIKNGKIEARELRCDKNEYFYWRNDYESCEVTFQFDL